MNQVVTSRPPSYPMKSAMKGNEPIPAADIKGRRRKPLWVKVRSTEWIKCLSMWLLKTWAGDCSSILDDHWTQMDKEDEEGEKDEEEKDNWHKI